MVSVTNSQQPEVSTGGGAAGGNLVMHEASREPVRVFHEAGPLPPAPLVFLTRKYVLGKSGLEHEGQEQPSPNIMRTLPWLMLLPLPVMKLEIDVTALELYTQYHA